MSARSNNRRSRLLLRRLGRSGSRSAAGAAASAAGAAARQQPEQRHRQRQPRSSGIGREAAASADEAAASAAGAAFRILLGCSHHQRESRDRGGESNVQFHVGVPQKYLVVSETKQTFVAAICIAARDFIDSPIHLKQLQILSADGDRALTSSRMSPMRQRANGACSSVGNAICCVASMPCAPCAAHRIEP